MTPVRIGPVPPTPPVNPLAELALESLGLKLVAGSIRPTPLVLTWLLPQPLGGIPPHVFGLPHDWAGFTFEDVTEFANRGGVIDRQRAAAAAALAADRRAAQLAASEAAAAALSNLDLIRRIQSAERRLQSDLSGLPTYRALVGEFTRRLAAPIPLAAVSQRLLGGQLVTPATPDTFALLTGATRAAAGELSSPAKALALGAASADGTSRSLGFIGASAGGPSGLATVWPMNLRDP